MSTTIRERLLMMLWLSPLAVLSVISVGVLILTFTRYEVPPPVYLYSDSVAPAEPPALCPGQRFTYPADIRIVEAPASVAIVEAVWSVDRKQTVMFDDAPKWAAYTEADTIHRTFTYDVPAGLPPGSYELRVVAQEFGAKPSGLIVPFEVKRGCK